jgi:D-3-phosphoglycerate dehydrogenase
MQTPLVAVTDAPFASFDPARAVLSKVHAELRMAERPTADAIAAAAREADAVIVTYAKLSADTIRQLTRCRIIARFGIGVDNIDIAAATSAGILVTNVPDYCIDEVSDHALALLLALARKIPFANARTHAGGWETSAVAPIHRLRGSVLGLVGFGRIPQLVAPKAQAFGFKVVTYDPYIPQEVLARAGVQGVDFAELLRISDYISVHAPLTEKTHHLFNAGTLSQMRPTAYLINTARGPLVDEEALARALDAGQLAGAALDVLSQEPPSGSPLLGHDKVILTPHMSYYSVESLVDLQTKGAEEVVRALTGEPPRNPVNPEVLKQQAG